VDLRHPRSPGCCSARLPSAFVLLPVNTLGRITVIVAAHSFVPPTVYAFTAVVVLFRNIDIQSGQLIFFWK
jgi:hypothetical protein